jgi:menaquinone-dependent protoporphyrinogen oxidase
MSKRRVLIVYGTNGDAGDDLARYLALALRQRGIPAEVCEADEVPALEDYDGVAIEGAREGAGWTLFARDFARRHASELKNLPAWFLSSTRAPGDGDVAEQTRCAHAIARWLGTPPAESRLVAWPGTLAPRARSLPN